MCRCLTWMVGNRKEVDMDLKPELLVHVAHRKDASCLQRCEENRHEFAIQILQCNPPPGETFWHG